MNKQELVDNSVHGIPTSPCSARLPYNRTTIEPRANGASVNTTACRGHCNFRKAQRHLPAPRLRSTTVRCLAALCMPNAYKKAAAGPVGGFSELSCDASIAPLVPRLLLRLRLRPRWEEESRWCRFPEPRLALFSGGARGESGASSATSVVAALRFLFFPDM